jgi:hypothetical protein
MIKNKTFLYKDIKTVSWMVLKKFDFFRKIQT